MKRMPKCNRGNKKSWAKSIKTNTRANKEKCNIIRKEATTDHRQK